MITTGDHIYILKIPVTIGWSKKNNEELLVDSIVIPTEEEIYCAVNKDSKIIKMQIDVKMKRKIK